MSVFAVEYVYSPDQNDVREEHRPSHREWLGTLVEQGRVLASGPFSDGTGALLIFTADTENDLHSLVSQDPFARAGVISAVKTTEWKPVMGAFNHLV
ncbi:YciI family protein [Arthrobacter sp. H41]|uniref:YciI family protein n=1 Tax=Arthrobacter sp. H41 TaxID=1312978 RepID=UPI00047A70EB|nr:YciI family protein [Arthrobacter sp. H41]